MLNDFFCLTPVIFESASPFMTEKTGGVIITHIIDLERKEALSELLQHQFSPQGNYPFSVAIRNFDQSQLSLLDNLLLLLCHPFYYRHFNKKVIFLHSLISERANYRNSLAEIFVRQLIDAAVVPLPDRILSQSKPALIRMNEECSAQEMEDEDPATMYFRYYTESYRPDDIFLVNTGQSYSPSSVMADVDAVHNRLQSEKPQLFSLFSEILSLQKRTLALVKSNRLLEDEKKILQELLDLSSKHDEVNYILNFYKSEYEVLPLWYKRFGHIIKVLTGKRTLKSLFK